MLGLAAVMVVGLYGLSWQQVRLVLSDKGWVSCLMDEAGSCYRGWMWGLTWIGIGVSMIEWRRRMISQDSGLEQAVPGAGRGRIVQIDSLRGVAAVIVVLFHFTTKYRELYAPTLALPFDIWWGHYGVNLFFIISGFVIFMTLSRSRDWRDFVVSRFSRLYPAYWVAVALTFSVVAWLGLPGKEVTFKQALLNFLMFHTWFRVPSVDGVYWTLLVELHFYVLALMLFVCGRMSQCFFWLWMLFALKMICFVGSNVFGLDLPYAIQRVLVLDFIPWFSLGICAYFLTGQGEAPRWKPLVTAAGALGLIGLSGGGLLVLIGVGCFVLVILAGSGRLWGAGNPVLLWLGTISYTLYLLHENIGWAVMRQAMNSGLSYAQYMPLTLVLVLMLASGLAFLVERPAMAWIRRLYKSRKKRLVADRVRG